jgi:hypothetical protein
MGETAYHMAARRFIHVWQQALLYLVNFSLKSTPFLFLKIFLILIMYFVLFVQQERNYCIT